MLCDGCQGLLRKLQEQPIQTTGIEHHACVAHVRSAVANGCPICRRLDAWEIDEDERETDWSTFVTTRWHDFDTRLPPGVIDVHFRSKKIVSQDDNDSFGPYTGNLRLIAVDANRDRLQVPGYRPSSIVGAADAIGLARWWIRTCDENHSACKRPPVKNSPNWRPTRLVYVGEDDTQLRLTDGDSLPDDIKYTTLSHCWGKMDNRLVLTKANIDHWSKRLPALDQWKTFADAIDITRHLGLLYIWIDSLCIIQDSVRDWQSESPHMCDVYKRSYCNIAATSAPDDAGGCFWDRNIDVDLPLRIHFGGSTDRVDCTANIIAAGRGDESLSGVYDICNDQTWFNDVKGSVLNSRGWVLQERMISSRVLNFANTQMYWECDELQASESYPYGFPFEAYASVSFKSLNPFRLESQPIEDRYERAFEVWGQAVQAYTTGSPFNDDGFVRNLTKASDKLVAFSAVARELYPFLDCRYVAGHWERDLVRQLAWKGANYSERPDAYRAPSWSWASVDAPIQDFIGLYGDSEGRGRTWQALVDVIDVKVELETSDTMGQVKSGFLQLYGKLLQVNVVQVSSSRYGNQQQDDDGIVLIGDCRTTLRFQRDEERVPFVTPRRLFCLPISTTFSENYTKIVDVQSILLEQTETHEVYRRVGYLGPKIWHDPAVDDLTEDPVLHAIGIRQDAPDGKLMVKPSTVGMKTITII